MPKHKNDGQPLFPELIKNPLIESTKIIRDPFNLADSPLAIFGKRNLKLYQATVYRNENGGELTVIGNKELKIEVLYGHELDYLYALMDMLYDEYRVGPCELLFLLSHLIRHAGRKPEGREYRRASRILEKLCWLRRRSTGLILDMDGKIKFMQADLSPILESWAIIGSPRRGRKKALADKEDGYCSVVFEEWFIKNIEREDLSSPMNFNFLMKISTPLGRRYFRLINSMRNREGKDEITRYLHDVAARIPLSAVYYFSQIKRILDPLHDELIELKYLKKVDYRSENGSTLITYFFSKFDIDQALAIQELVSRKVAIEAAEELANSKPAKFILDVVRLFDISKKEKRVFESGWIVKVIKTADSSSIEQSLARYKAAKKNRPRSLPRESKLRDFYDQEIAEKLVEARKHLSPTEISTYEARAKEIVPVNTRELGESAYRLSLESVIDRLIREDFKDAVF